MPEREPRFIPEPENQPTAAKDALAPGTEPRLSYEEEIRKPLNESDRQHFAVIPENVKKLAELERTNSEWFDRQTLCDVIFRDHILERALYDEALAPEAMRLIHQVREVRSYVTAETVRGIMIRHLPQIERQVTAEQK